MAEAVPFSEIWYKDCFYHALFSAILTFGKRHETMQVNDFYKYSLSTEGILSYQQCKDLSVEEGLARIGIEISTFRLENNVINSLKKWIDKGYLVIVNVDRMVLKSEASNVDTTCHSVLVYGYENDTFFIMENRYVSSCLFERKEISAELLNEAYLSFINKLKHFKYGMYVVKDIGHCADESDLIFIMQQCLTLNIGIRKKSLTYLQNYIDSISSVFQSETDFKAYSDIMMKVMNEIIVNKTIEEYSISRIINNPEYTTALQSILNKWKYCRTLVYKYQLLNRFAAADMKKIVDTFHEIVAEEKLFIKKLEE